MGKKRGGGTEEVTRSGPSWGIVVGLFDRFRADTSRPLLTLNATTGYAVVLSSPGDMSQYGGLYGLAGRGRFTLLRCFLLP